ncbi:MAG: SDR family NAD(P)-dependent oxidoreductase [Rhizobiaceae bacterium]|nr:SDR family NAD(P)-dependent oxidoreductase [Rhizobiaceae bacterium]
MSNSETRPVCLVTGGARRIGRAILTELAADFDLAIHANTSRADADELAEQLAANGARTKVFVADFSEPDCAGQMVEAVAKHFGRLDLVVNSASTFEYDTPSEFSTETMQRILTVNLVSQMVIARVFGALGSDGATLINILDNKVYAPNPDFFSYSLAKFALKSSIDMLAMHYRGKMRVCGIAPGITLISGDQTPENFEKSWRHSLTGTGSTPDQIARTVRFIWQTKALNADVIVLDGGQRLMSLERDVAFAVE